MWVAGEPEGVVFKEGFADAAGLVVEGERVYLGFDSVPPVGQRGAGQMGVTCEGEEGDLRMKSTGARPTRPW